MSDTPTSPANSKNPPVRTGAPWRAPKPLPGTENTPSSNPNYRRVAPPKPQPAQAKSPPAAPPATRA
jgi:hypothetical protein